jgi:hypothetical protein
MSIEPCSNAAMHTESVSIGNSFVVETVGTAVASVEASATEESAAAAVAATFEVVAVDSAAVAATFEVVAVDSAAVAATFEVVAVDSAAVAATSAVVVVAAACTAGVAGPPSTHSGVAVAYGFVANGFAVAVVEVGIGDLEIPGQLLYFDLWVESQAAVQNHHITG